MTDVIRHVSPVALYTPYAEAGLILPLPPLVAEAMHFCDISVSQFPPAAIDSMMTFTLLCRRSGIEVFMPVFLIWFTMTSMTTDPRHLLIAQRSGDALFDQPVDRSHHWRGRFFFVPVSALGLSESEVTIPSRWALLTQLKTRTTAPSRHALAPLAQIAQEVLTEIYRRGAVNARTLAQSWSYEAHLALPVKMLYFRDGPLVRHA